MMQKTQKGFSNSKNKRAPLQSGAQFGYQNNFFP